MIRRPIALALAFVLAATTVSTAPLTAQTVGNPDLFGKSLEVARHALEQYGELDDREERKRLNDIGYRVAQEAGFTAFPLTFHLIEMPEPNAFALPGGQLFVTRGMLELGLTDDMLAALMGHEIGHVVLDHHTEMRRKATLVNILSQVMMVGVMIAANNSSEPNGRNPYDPRNADNSKGDLIQGTAAASLLVGELLLRSNSRENESDADREGQRWAAAAGYSPTGAAELMALMGSRIPQDKKYGYWMTHPFFDERVRSAAVTAKQLTRKEARPADAFRQRTQAALLLYSEHEDAPEEAVPLVKDEALWAWPQGPAAERLRLEKLEALGEKELAQTSLSRDYGMLIREYRDQVTQVRELTPESAFLKVLAAGADALGKQRDDLYPKAVRVLEEGVFETSFLETYLSNFADSKEIPRVALDLGEAYSRLGNQTEAIRLFLRSWEAAPESPEGQRAGRGLRNLAPTLEGLSALQQLALQRRDPELREVAAERLSQRAASFEDIGNGAEYLRRFPDGPFVDTVVERVNSLATNLYGEVLLYQAVGDNVKAIERINKILTLAPASPAAEQLRDRAVFES